MVKFIIVQGLKTWKELTTGVPQLVRLLFNNNFINPGLATHFLFSKTILNVGRARAAIVDFTKYIYTTGWVISMTCINLYFKRL